MGGGEVPVSGALGAAMPDPCRDHPRRLFELPAFCVEAETEANDLSRRAGRSVRSYRVSPLATDEESRGHGEGLAILRGLRLSMR